MNVSEPHPFVSSYVHESDGELIARICSQYKIGFDYETNSFYNGDGSKIPLQIVRELGWRGAIQNVEESEEKEEPVRGHEGVHFSDIANELIELYSAKNADYGNSFDKTLDELGPIAGYVRMSDKMNRLKTLVVDEKDRVIEDESVEDTLKDLASYAIMTAVWLSNKR